MTYANAFICLFLFLGACFGFASCANRRLFSEGSQKATTSDQNPFLESRIFWIMVCMWLWPIMVISVDALTALLKLIRKLKARTNETWPSGRREHCRSRRPTRYGMALRINFDPSKLKNSNWYLTPITGSAAKSESHHRSIQNPDHACRSVQRSWQ